MYMKRKRDNLYCSHTNNDTLKLPFRYIYAIKGVYMSVNTYTTETLVLYIETYFCHCITLDFVFVSWRDICIDCCLCTLEMYLNDFDSK